MAKPSRVSRSLYRSLLKMARNFDETPASKSLLYRTDLYNTNKTAAAKYYTNLLSQLFEKDSYLFQPKDGAISLIQLIREESRAVNDKISVPERLDAGFAALRKLSSLWNVYTEQDEVVDDDESEDEDQEHFTVLNSDVSLATALSPGVLLLAHPMLQGPLHRSVILLLEHNSKGSYGVVINHRTSHNVQSSVKNLPENILEVFGHSSVAFGGMVRRLTYLHNVQQVGGVAIPTCKKPLYAGGEILKALRFVQESRAAVNHQPPAVCDSVAADVNTETTAETKGDADALEHPIIQPNEVSSAVSSDSVHEVTINSPVTGTQEDFTLNAAASAGLDTAHASASSPSFGPASSPPSPSSTSARTSSAPTTSASSVEEEWVDIDPAERFRFFVGCCLWEGGNLERELASGYWIPTHSEPDTVLDLAMLPAVLPVEERESGDSADDDLEEDRIAAEDDEIEAREVEIDGVEKIGEKIDTVGKTFESVLASESAKGLPNKGLDATERPMNEARGSVSGPGLGSGSGIGAGSEKVQEYFQEEMEEEYSVDVWKALLRSLGQPYSAMADLPPWVSAKNVESADWK